MIQFSLVFSFYCRNLPCFPALTVPYFTLQFEFLQHPKRHQQPLAVLHQNAVDPHRKCRSLWASLLSLHPANPTNAPCSLVNWVNTKRMRSWTNHWVPVLHFLIRQRFCWDERDTGMMLYVWRQGCMMLQLILKLNIWGWWKLPAQLCTVLVHSWCRTPRWN